MATSQTIEKSTSGATADTAPLKRRTIAAYRGYATAERAVDYLSDQGFAVGRTAIVGKGLHSVEQARLPIVKRGEDSTRSAPTYGSTADEEGIPLDAVRIGNLTGDVGADPGTSGREAPSAVAT